MLNAIEIETIEQTHKTEDIQCVLHMFILFYNYVCKYFLAFLENKDWIMSVDLFTNSCIKIRDSPQKTSSA